MAILNCRQQYICGFWIITIPIAIYIVILLSVAVVNPFWFRDDFLSWLHEHVTTLSDWRGKKLEPLKFKMNLFETIKKGA